MNRQKSAWLALLVALASMAGFASASAAEIIYGCAPFKGRGVVRHSTKRVVRTFPMLFLAVALVLMATATNVMAETIFESGTLGPMGIAQGSVAATNITPHVFTGVRFELSQPVVTSHVGGHFVDRSNGTFFGAIVRLDDENDFPDSGDLTTPDVIGATVLTFPAPSAEVFGNLTLALDPGWYALVFGSGLFGTSGDGAAPQNNPDIGNPAYIAFQPGSGFGWVNISTFTNHRFVVKGSFVPEPSTIALVVFASLLYFFSRVRSV